jgi:hypothetical protein
MNITEDGVHGVISLNRLVDSWVWRSWTLIIFLVLIIGISPFVGVSKPEGSLGRRVNCRRVPQPRWVDARRNAKGGKEAAGGRQA